MTSKLLLETLLSTKENSEYNIHELYFNIKTEIVHSICNDKIFIN